MKIQMLVADANNILLKNRDAHVFEYTAQIEGWKLAMDAYTTAFTEWASKGGVGDRPHMTQKPTDFTEDYDFLLRQLFYHTPLFITVDEHDFKQIVLNEFGWKGTFTANSNLYSNGNH